MHKNTRRRNAFLKDRFGFGGTVCFIIILSGWMRADVRHAFFQYENFPASLKSPPSYSTVLSVWRTIVNECCKVNFCILFCITATENLWTWHSFWYKKYINIMHKAEMDAALCRAFLKHERSRGEWVATFNHKHS